MESTWGRETATFKWWSVWEPREETTGKGAEKHEKNPRNLVRRHLKASMANNISVTNMFS